LGSLGDVVEEVAFRLIELAVKRLPRDVISALKNAYETEVSDLGKMQLEAVLKNIRLADERSTLICQDTGTIVFFVKIGKGLRLNDDLTITLKRATKEATEKVPLRPNIVHPLTRMNSLNNTGVGVPIIHFDLIEDEYLELTAMPKGAGAENMSALKMLNPTEGINGIKRSVINTVAEAGGKPCPPTVIGLGIGGTSDHAMVMAKRALIRPLNKSNVDPELSKLETEILETINRTGVGPMGLGGRWTSLGVRIEHAYCHTASLPLAINMQCWAARRAAARIYPDRAVEYLYP